MESFINDVPGEVVGMNHSKQANEFQNHLI